MNVLITAPSLNVNKNVSGISSVVSTIIHNNKATKYIHFLAGKEDTNTSMSKRMRDLAKSYVALIRIFRKQPIDLVHLNLPLNPKSIYREFLVFTISRMFQKKILVHVHGGKYLLEQPANKVLNSIIKRIYTGAAMVICLSDIEKQSIEKTYHIRAVKVLENTVDDLYLRLIQSSNSSSKITVLFLGRLHESKGVHVLIASITELMKQNIDNLHFIFCGAGPLLHDVVTLAATYPQNVSYMGIVSGEQKSNMLCEAQIFVLPSLYGEGLPMSLIEAMAAGVVPIVTNDGSMKAIVTHDKTGYIIEKNDVVALSTQLSILANNLEAIKAVSNNAKAFIRQRFSINKYINSLNEYYSISVAS